MRDVPLFDLVAGGPVYVYMQVADHVAARIEAGHLPPGSRLPSEYRLAREYGVSYGSIRQAMGLLRDRGLVFTVRPKGTFVEIF